MIDHYSLTLIREYKPSKLETKFFRRIERAYWIPEQTRLAISGVN